VAAKANGGGESKLWLWRGINGIWRRLNVSNGGGNGVAAIKCIALAAAKRRRKRNIGGVWRKRVLMALGMALALMAPAKCLGNREYGESASHRR
jgi:hypothetical protein